MCSSDLFGHSESDNDSLAYGIVMDPDSAQYATIENCGFFEVLTAGIQLIGEECIVKDNIFNIPASGIGIEYTSTTGTNVDNKILSNFFQGSASSDTGIKITNSPTNGTFLVAYNFLSNCATTITTTKGEIGRAHV